MRGLNCLSTPGPRWSCTARVPSPLLRILSSRTSVCPMGIFLFRAWAERRNMASTAEPFSRAIWSSRSRERKPVGKSTSTDHTHVSQSSMLFQTCRSENKMKKCKKKYLEYFWWTPPGPELDLLPFRSAAGSFPPCYTGPGAGKHFFTVTSNKLRLLKHHESVPHQFLCHILRNLMFVVSICDDFHERLLLFGDFNLLLRGTNPTHTFLPLAHSKHLHLSGKSCCYLWQFRGWGDVFAVRAVCSFCLVSGRLSWGGFGVLS